MSNPFAYVGEWRNRLSETGWWHSFELPDGTRIQGATDLEGQKRRLAQFPIPADLKGKRVLDIGAWDGWFTFEMERRGAEVVAIDRWDNPRFHEMRAMLRSRADYRLMDVYEISPQRLGRFDIVLFLGVLYHLRHPLLALERVCSVTADYAAVESFALTDRYLPGLGIEDHALMQFFEYDDFGGQLDNWFAPTPKCLMGMCRAAGFARVEMNNVQEYGAALSCYRRWPEAAAVSPAPELLSVFHGENYGINFRSDSADYLDCIAAPDGRTWGRDTVQIDVDGYGAAPSIVRLTEEGQWLIAAMLPPGLAPGWHSVRLRTAGSEWSAPQRIAVDIPAESRAITVESVSDGVTWETGRFSLEHRYFTLWVAGLPENADVNNVRVELDGRRQAVAFVGSEAADGKRQINARADSMAEPGVHQVAVAFGGQRSEAVSIVAA